MLHFPWHDLYLHQANDLQVVQDYDYVDYYYVDYLRFRCVEKLEKLSQSFQPTARSEPAVGFFI
jgi:hypothetical protein